MNKYIKYIKYKYKHIINKCKYIIQVISVGCLGIFTKYQRCCEQKNDWEPLVSHHENILKK